MTSASCLSDFSAICQALALGIPGCAREIFPHDHILPLVTLGIVGHIMALVLSGELTTDQVCCTSVSGARLVRFSA